MSELSKVHSLIAGKVQKQSTDRSIEIAKDLLERFDCLELLDAFVDSIENHSQAVSPQRYSHNDRGMYNDCLHLRDQFFDSIQKHSLARINRVSLRDSMRFND